MPEIEVKEAKKVQAKTLRVIAKVRDAGNYTLLDQSGQQIIEVDGYVPSFMPGEHYGDYLELDIDLDTGQITNWVKPEPVEIQEWVEGAS